MDRKKTISEKQTEQHNACLTAKWNKWRDVDKDCILVTQSINKEGKKQKSFLDWDIFFHNRKDDSSKDSLNTTRQYAAMFVANIAWKITFMSHSWIFIEIDHWYDRIPQ